MDQRRDSTHNAKKNEVESHGAPLHFPEQDELKITESMKQTVLDAKKASDAEHKMTLLQGIKLYPKAIGWSVLISTCIAMEGFQIALVNNFYAFDQFNRKYGALTDDGTYQVSFLYRVA